MSEKNKSLMGLVWLASYPKSGNTWTRNFLHNIMSIMAGEDDGAYDINDMSAMSTWEVGAQYYEELLGKPVTKCDRAEIAAIRPKVQKFIAENAGGLAFVKTHHAMVLDRGVPAINFDVTAGAIYIVRNPLDVATSFANHLNATTDKTVEQMAVEDAETPMTDKVVYEIYGSWSQHVESWTRKPHRAIYVMRYEDMLADPRKSFGGLVRHLLLKPSDEELDRAIELSSFDVLKKQEQESEAGFKEKPIPSKEFFRSGKAGGWRTELNDDQIRCIISRHREQMIRFGYVPEGY